MPEGTWANRLLCTMAGEEIALLTVSLTPPGGNRVSRRTTQSNLF